MFEAPSVVRKHGGRHAIIVTKGRTLYGVVEMESSPLRLRQKNEKSLREEGWERTTYSPSKAAETFLTHPAGCTPLALAALNEVIELSFLE